MASIKNLIKELKQFKNFPMVNQPTIDAAIDFAEVELRRENKLTEKEFCKLYTQLNGEKVDNIKQITLVSFTGESLLEFINDILKQKS